MLAALKMWNTGVSAQAWCTGLQFLFHHMEFSSRSVPASFPGKIFLIWKIYYLANLTPVFPSFCLTWRIELLASGCQPSPLTLAQDWHPPCLPHRRYNEFPLFNWNTLQPCWTPGTFPSADCSGLQCRDIFTAFPITEQKLLLHTFAFL